MAMATRMLPRYIGKSNVIFRRTAFHLGFENCPSNFSFALHTNCLD